MKLGVCYYPEHWPEERWPEDARLMRQVGLTYVRIGEFAWAQMEPSEGQFDWRWLDKAIGALAAEGLLVLLCTPTAAPPAWMVQADPEILPVDQQGRVRNFGARRHYCPNKPTYQRHTRRIVTALALRYGAHPAVVGWQIDNEFGCHNTARCYCECCAIEFRSWLMARYDSLANLNGAWGTAFWSQVYTDWNQIDPPIMTVSEPNPSHVLDYYRFSSDSVVAYQQLQVDLLRQYTQGQFITTNLMGNFIDLNYHDLAHPLDFVAWDSYPTGYIEVPHHDMHSPEARRPPHAHDVGDPYITGFCHDLTRGLKQSPFWVMEQQCGNINWSDYNTGIRPGAVRLWTWHALASGAETVVYFRWRASLYAQEQYHSGLLNHDASLSVGFDDLQAMADERELMYKVAQAPIQAQAALLLDYNDIWALKLQPHRKDFEHLRHLFCFYRALAQLGIQTDIVSPKGDLSGYKLLIAPTAFLVDQSLADILTQYTEAGGTLLLGVRSGFKKNSNLVTDKPLPGLLRKLVGTRVTAWHSLPPNVGYAIESSIPDLTDTATFWVEALNPDAEPTTKWQHARSLANYIDGPFMGQAALTERMVGTGRALYLGWYPTLSQASALLTHLAEKLNLPTLPGIPEGVVAMRRGTFTILLNFNEEPLTVQVEDKTIMIEGRDVKIV